MNALVVRVTTSDLEDLIKAAKENEASQRVFTTWEGKGDPECICLVIEDDSDSDG